MLRWILPLLGFSCIGGDTGKTESGALTWYISCGDPACSGYSGPFEGVPLCEGTADGDACTEEGATCDPKDSCNATLTCGYRDPDSGPCPISLRRYKTDIHYLDRAEADQRADALLQTRLARYHYKGADPRQPARLGFLIDDQPTSPAVLPDGQHVDVYGYTSMAVATIQRQQAEIDALRAELDLLRAEVAAIKTR